MKKRSQSVNVKHRKISFGDFQTETIGISVKKILIEVPLNVYLVVFAINGIIIKYRLKNTLKKLKG